MADDLNYALLAGAAYFSQRDPINRIYPTADWSLLSRERDDSSGYEASAYRNGTEIVIAFAGTDEPEDWAANFSLATAVWTAAQLYKAAEFYARIRQANPEAAISFTGHSLGGGLAALMGVFFDRAAVTFDPAPFRASANNDTRQDLRDYLARTLNPATGTPLLTDELAAALDTFYSDRPGASAAVGIPGDGGLAHSIKTCGRGQRRDAWGCAA